MEWILPGILFVVLVVVLFVNWPFKKVRIREYERGLKYEKGRFVGVLPAGEHWIRKRRDEVTTVDIRPVAVSIPGQEILSSDGVTLKVSLVSSFEISDPDTAVNKVQSYMSTFYMALQIALREIVGTLTIEDLLAKRNEISQRVYEQASAEVDKLGLKLLSASVKDIMFPGELKKIFSQAVKARNEGLASLERARGETAALRSLANAAKMVEQNPALMQLRMMHSIGDSTGNTFVVGVPAGVVPVSKSKASANDNQATDATE